MTTSPSKNVSGFFSGRSTRREYWLSMLGLVALNVVLTLVIVTPAIVSALSLPLWIVSGSRRLHDIGRTGWWSLLPVGIGFLVGFVSGLGADVPAMPALIINGVATVLTAVIVGSLTGTKGPNRFGPDPRARPQDLSAVFD